MARKNQALRLNAAFKAWYDNNPEKNGLSFGEALDWFSKRQGVGCDGVINGVALNGVFGRLALETINSVDTLTFRECEGGTILFSTASQIDPQAVSKQYRATLLGANGSFTSATISKNDLSAAIVWAYSAEGVYTGTLVGAFTAGKTNILLSNLDATGGVILSAVRTSADVITLSTFAVDGTTPADFIGNIQVQIIVDPA